MTTAMATPLVTVTATRPPTWSGRPRCHHRHRSDAADGPLSERRPLPTAVHHCPHRRLTVGIPMERVGGPWGSPESPTLQFFLTDSVSCSGYFTWTAVSGATSYTLKRTVPITQAGTIDSPVGFATPPSSSIPNIMDVTNGQEYRVLASQRRWATGRSPILCKSVAATPPADGGEFRLCPGQPRSLRGHLQLGRLGRSRRGGWSAHLSGR